MSNFPSIEEFDSGRVTATKLEDIEDEGDHFQSAKDDFLAREQAVLGDDAAFFQSAGNTTSPPAQGGAAFFDADEDVQEFETSFPAIATTTNGMNQQESPVMQASVQKEEPEVIRQWREERNLQIQRREEIAAKKKQEVIDQAKQAIDDFYENYNNEKEKLIAQTRKEEEEFITARDESATGTAWERIAKYVDISEKSAAGGGPARYRELLLSLKNDANAPSNEA